MCSRMALNHITITVDKSVESFKHKVEEAKIIFADHPNKGHFLNEKDKSALSNYQQLIALGPHRLLAHQTNDKEPKRWVNITVQVQEKEKNRLGVFLSQGG